MDDRKQIKEFINYICDWVEGEHKEYGCDGFVYELTNDRMSYLIADKGIEKRITKQLFKRLGVKLDIYYILSPSSNQYLDGKLIIKLIINQFREIGSMMQYE